MMKIVHIRTYKNNGVGELSPTTYRHLILNFIVQWISSNLVGLVERAIFNFSANLEDQTLVGTKHQT